MTKIIIDSTSDLPKQLTEEYGIDMLPLRVHLEDKEYLDKVNITVEEVYDAMRKGIYPKTSLPNPKETYELFKNYASRGIDFIYYSFSSKLSSTYQTCKLIIEELKNQFPSVKMEVLDTKAGSFASGLISMQGAILSKLGIDFEEVVEVSKENIRNIEHVFTIDDLDCLLQGGRISKGSAIAGNILNIKPILDVEDGNIILIDKVRGRKKALKTVADLVEDRIRKFTDQVVGIVHADDLKAALNVKKMIQERLKIENILIEKIGSVLATHLGIGGVGIFFFNKKPEKYINAPDLVLP